ncbi:MAG: hypothetical protein HY303_15255 [Candidatus Wallbacteria bacterium]|nr:hypothetical protein [Candidatus Wallbacteria bacterium]
MAGQDRTSRTVDGVLAALRRGGFSVEVAATRGPGDATRLAREAAAPGDLEVVFALGGDGTLREAATGLLGSPVPLGPLPGGTTNVLHYGLGLPHEPEAAATALCRLDARPMDVGLCGGTPFLMMASAGLDSHVMSHLDGNLKDTFGVAGVLLEGIGHWLVYDYPEVAIEVDGRTLGASLAIVANIPFYGGPFRMAPLARIDDRCLDVVLFHGRGRRAMLSFVMDVMTDAHVHRQDVEFIRVQHVRLGAPRGMPIQVDGDAFGQTLPVTIDLSSDQLMVLAPPG